MPREEGSWVLTLSSYHSLGKFLPLLSRNNKESITGIQMTGVRAISGTEVHRDQSPAPLGAVTDS